MNQKPHFTLKHVLAVLCLLPFTLLNLTAQTTSVPDRINYQGTLLDATGAPLASGNYTLTFRLYSTETGGALLWGPQVFGGNTGSVGRASQVPVVDGQFNLILGPTDINGDNLSEAFQSSPRFLEITIGDENATTPIAPRQEILSTPYAFQAANAVPVGTIISLHPEAPAPNPVFWQLCDGSNVVAGSTLAGSMANTPSLTDSRFLMGGSGNTTETGGSNQTTLTVDNLPSHNHDMTHGHTINDPGHSHNMLFNRSNPGVSIGGSTQYYYFGSSFTNDRTETAFTNVTVNQYSGNTGSVGGDVPFDHRPNYFKVLYYIKIN